jgi:cytochrome c553
MMRIFILSTSLVLCNSAAWAESHAAVSEASDAAVPAQEVDMEAAKKVFRKSCRGCHGNKGQGAASYPRINDLEPEYMVEKLERYRAGEKFGPNSILMIQQAKKLSDEDIVNLSVYVATAFEE